MPSSAWKKKPEHNEDKKAGENNQLRPELIFYTKPSCIIDDGMAFRNNYPIPGI